jgi:hypothetical protein
MPNLAMLFRSLSAMNDFYYMYGFSNLNQLHLLFLSVKGELYYRA